MNRDSIVRNICLLLIAFVGCSSPTEPEITPLQPRFVNSAPYNSSVDHRIFADVDALHNAIVIEWYADTTNNSSGYILYRATDSTVGSDGLLASGQILAQFESSNSLGEPLPTSYQDTTNIIPGGTYWYQLRAFYRSPTNKITYSLPTHVDATTSFQFTKRLLQDAPAGPVTIPPAGLQFRWDNPDKGGQYQIILQRTDNQQIVWSYNAEDDYPNTTVVYPTTATPLITGIQYRWRVKRIVMNGGSTSPWMTFNIVP